MIIKDKYLSNAEYEATFGFWLIGTLMIIRGMTLLFTSEEGIARSTLYTTMDNLAPFHIWGVLFIIAAVIIIASSVSQSIKKYYGLVFGNLIGVTVGFPLAFISFASSHMTITQHTITLVAFFNLVLVIHGGIVIWKERKRIHTLRQ